MFKVLSYAQFYLILAKVLRSECSKKCSPSCFLLWWNWGSEFLITMAVMLLKGSIFWVFAKVWALLYGYIIWSQSCSHPVVIPGSVTGSYDISPVFSTKPLWIWGLYSIFDYLLHLFIQVHLMKWKDKAGRQSKCNDGDPS